MPISTDLRWLLLFCSLPLILIPVALLGGWTITWYGRTWNNLDASIRRRISYWHVAVDIVLLMPIVAIFSLFISQPASNFDLWLLVYVFAIPILGALYMILELYVVTRHTKSNKSMSGSMERDLPKADTFARQVEAPFLEELPMERNMIDSGIYFPSSVILVAVGLLVILLFTVMGVSFFMRGITGFIGTAASAFGLTLLAGVAQRTRPSRLWRAVEISLIVGMVASVLFVRAMSLQPGHYWNQWATFIALPIAAVCGSRVAASKWVAATIDWRYRG